MWEEPENWTNFQADDNPSCTYLLFPLQKQILKQKYAHEQLKPFNLTPLWNLTTHHNIAFENISSTSLTKNNVDQKLTLQAWTLTMSY